MTLGPRERVMRLLEAARCLADPQHPLGQRARAELPSATGLSAENIEYALTHCLETRPSEAELELLLARSPKAERAWVLLSATVFSAAHRALALALASSATVLLRPSSRQPHFAQLLHQAAPSLFTVVDVLDPDPGDAVWAYGSDATLTEVHKSVKTGVNLISNGHGFGVIVLTQQTFINAHQAMWSAFADGAALDTALFDQRGCLSPRLVLLQGSLEFKERAVSELCAGLDRMQGVLPLGTLSAEERADLRWYRECVACLGEWHPTRGGAVAVVQGRVELVSPPGRVLQVCHIEDLSQTLSAVAPLLTCVAQPVGSVGSDLSRLAPNARHCSVGQMQQPPFDGPVDLRSLA